MSSEDIDISVFVHSQVTEEVSTYLHHERQP